METLARLAFVAFGIGLLCGAILDWNFLSSASWNFVTDILGRKFNRFLTGAIGIILALIGLLAFLGAWTILQP